MRPRRACLAPLTFVTFALSVFLAAPLALAQCDLRIGPAFPLPGVDDTVNAVAQWNDGSGNALYVGGSFRTAGAIAADRIAKWNGSEWSSVGDGLSGTVCALAVFNDGQGGGPALFAAGSFLTASGITVNRIAKWDGHAWSPLASGLTGGEVRCLAVFDDDAAGPNPPSLYAGGAFTHAGDLEVNHIARWDGSAWHDLDQGIGEDKVANVYALEVFDQDGSGAILPALFAGARFDSAGPILANNIAKWDGASWSTLDSGVNGFVFSLKSFDRGTGTQLYVGGYFSYAGGSTSDSIARWNGNTWQNVANGLYLQVTAMTVYDPDGSGISPPVLYIGGFITVASGVYVSNLARWSGLQFSTVNGGTNNTVTALGVYDDGAGPALIAGGSFTRAGDAPASRIARWRPSSWTSFGSGITDLVRDIEIFDDGRGPAAFCATNVAVPGGVHHTGVARWNGSAWSSVGHPANGRFTSVNALTSGPLGSAPPSLFAAGRFQPAIGAELNLVAQWTGNLWTPLASAPIGPCSDLIFFDDGQGGGPALFAAGSFTTADGVPANRIAKWDGKQWLPLGEGMDAPINSLAVFDDGRGHALYAGGEFTTAGGVPANRLARWNGSNWSAVYDDIRGNVTSMTVLNDGKLPPRLVVSAESNGGINAWDGVTWTRVAYPGSISGRVFTLDLDADGPEPQQLFAGSPFSQWIGDLWMRWTSDDSSIASAVLFDPDGPGPAPRALLVGGGFSSINGVITSRLGTIWPEGPPPQLDDLPARIVADLYDSVEIRLSNPPSSPVNYTWRHNGVPLDPFAQGDSTLSFVLWGPTYEGAYDVIVTTPCGSSISTPTLVTLRCPADFNRSDLVDSQDLFDFLAAFFNFDADFNHDGFTDSADFFAFLEAFFSPCA